MVATSTITRGALNSRRMTVSSIDRAVQRADGEGDGGAEPVGNVVLDDQEHEQAGADEAHVADGEVDDSGGPVDEHDAHRQQPEDRGR